MRARSALTVKSAPPRASSEPAARRLGFLGGLPACATCIAIATLAAPRVALAAGPLGPNGARITTSSYQVDLTQTPILAGARPLGLGGAYVAIAEGTDGNFQNAAAPAVRVPYSFDWFDYDVGIGFQSAGAVEENDFFNTGQPTETGTAKEENVFVNLAGNLQFGAWGFGLAIEAQSYALDTREDAKLDATVAKVRLQVARNFFDHQLVVGLGPRLVNLNVRRPNPPPGESADLLDAANAALEFGALFKPNEAPYRLGAAFRSQVLGDANEQPPVPPNAVGDYVYGDPASPDAIFLPRSPALPWDLDVGGAVQLGPRPFNPRWINPKDASREIVERNRERELARRALRKKRVAEIEAEGGDDPDAAIDALDAELERERDEDGEAEDLEKERLRNERRAAYLAMSRFYVLVTASVVITGSVADAVGVESFLRQEVDRSGEDVTYSPRLGVETEPLTHWIKLRVGAYYEPTRFDNGLANDRIHGTAGFELKILPWTVFGIFDDPTWWRAGAVADVADRYFSWGLTAGVWH